MQSTYSFKTHARCSDTSVIIDLTCQIAASEFISVYDLLAEIKRITAEPISRPSHMSEVYGLNTDGGQMEAPL